MQQWNFLKPGDVVDIIAPASHSPHDKLENGVKWLSSLGLIPRVPADLIKPDVFFASPLATQFKHLREAIYSDASAIWCLRGGYGSMRLVPHLLKLKPPKKPKLFIGFSDITSLHLFFNQQWGWPTLHGRTIGQLLIGPKNSPDRRELQKIIFGELTEKIFKNLVPLNESAHEERSLSGKIIGGNLRILQSSLGTKWEVNPKNKILFMEDVCERGYSVDRMLGQMFQAGLIDKGLKALVIGDFTQCEEKDGKDLSPIAFKRFAQRVKYPVLKGLPVGHDATKNFTLPLNTNCQLITGKKGQLRCEFGGSKDR